MSFVYIVLNNEWDIPRVDKDSKVFYDKNKAINYRLELIHSEEFQGRKSPMGPDMTKSIDEEYYKIQEIEIVL